MSAKDSNEKRQRKSHKGGPIPTLSKWKKQGGHLAVGLEIVMM